MKKYYNSDVVFKVTRICAVVEKKIVIDTKKKKNHDPQLNNFCL